MGDNRMIHQWSWMWACSTGSSHLKAGAGCQDFATCFEMPYGDDTALIAVVSDGAGSARFASQGSRTVVRTMVRRLAGFVHDNGSNGAAVTQDVARQWLNDTRNAIVALARGRDAGAHDFAATLVAAVALPSRMVVCHVGDGACAARRQGEANWMVVSWPAHGEYASSTFFVTDQPEPRLQMTCLDGAFSDLAVFSDGLEQLVLDFRGGTASNRFFDPMSLPLSALGAGHERRLSGHLRKFLDSPRVIERTDDDKTLIVAKRATTRVHSDESVC